MYPRYADISRYFLALPLLISSSLVGANECEHYAQRSVNQQERNLFNLCGYRGAQWSSDSSRWQSECKSMSLKDQRQRLSVRDRFLAQCAVVAYPDEGRNRQNKLFRAVLKSVEKNDFRHTELLIKAGANLSYQPASLGRSPLFIAVKNNNIHLARLLVRGGAKPYIQAAGEVNVLSLVLSRKQTNYPLFEFLLQNKANPNSLGNQAGVEYPLVIAAKKSDFRSIELLLRYKANTNLYHERSALQFAVGKDHYPMARALVKGGANPNLGAGGKVCNGTMALDIAYRSAKERVVNLLLDHHALTARECRS